MDGVVTGILITASLTLQVLSSGMFEIAILSLYNGNGKRLDGRCCSGSNGTCSGDCRSFVTACLLQQMADIPEEPDCIFGNTHSTVFEENTINTENILPMNISFHFLWPAVFTLVVDARHDNDLHLSQNDSSQIIIRSVVSDVLYPPSLWYTETTTGDSKALQYRYRVLCDDNYFGAGCEVFCRPRNDSFGHYVCDGDGNKVCLPGWLGEFCQTAMCWDKCKMSYGFCYEPFKCSCMIGWEGESCDQCVRRENCVNGYCHEPWQCICQGDWTGDNCDIDINYCNKYDPCENGGVCLHNLKKNFTCQCKDGFTGTNCEYRICTDGFCQNGGTCSSTSIGCECTEKYYGHACQFRKLTCDETDCMNGGTCIPTPTGTICNCSSGYTGENCKSEINECQSNPCLYGGVCTDLIDGYYCSCKSGYIGINCETVANPCMGVTCFHDGTCVSSDIGNDATCVCKPGNTGYRCEIVIDSCSNIDCQNGGVCTRTDIGFGFQCTCQPGFSGVHCEINLDPCTYVVCANGGTCKSYTDDYLCICNPHYSGVHCENLLMLSDQTAPSIPKDNVIPNIKDDTNSSVNISYTTVYLLCLVILMVIL